MIRRFSVLFVGLALLIGLGVVSAVSASAHRTPGKGATPSASPSQSYTHPTKPPCKTTTTAPSVVVTTSTSPPATVITTTTAPPSVTTSHTTSKPPVVIPPKLKPPTQLAMTGFSVPAGLTGAALLLILGVGAQFGGMKRRSH